MEKRESDFRIAAERVAFDAKHRKVILHNIGRYDSAVRRGKGYFRSVENARIQAGKIKNHVVNNLEGLLLGFEEQATKQGWEIYWASYADDVLKVIGRAIEVEVIKSAVKMKSMVSEEIHLNDFLSEKEVEAHETDLGEFIVQTAGERPYHILTPAMHKSKEDVAELFNQKFDLHPESTPVEITAFVRDFLREKFTTADLGVTGANFLLADTGSVALTENEGNGMQTFAWPRVLITIAGIEKILPEWSDLDLFWPILAVHGTGQHMTAYNSILTGPRKSGETDGPERAILILFDGGRTELLQQPGIRDALQCIRCGACLNACPVYQAIGGFTYETVYTGPIGSVISGYLEGSRDAGFLNFASSLCGKCTEVCPVGIPLHDLLLQNRKKLVDASKKMGYEKFFFGNYKKMMLKRKKLERVGASWKNRAMKTVGARVWGPRRAPLIFAKESFSSSWKRKKPMK